MIELLLLLAIGYAGARGVEHLAGTSDRRHDRAVHHDTVKKIAADPAHKKPVTKPGPVEEGGTFSAAAPRSALFGGKAAVPLAVLTETGATMWRAAGEGYRERWPQIRAERREKMKARAARKEKEKAEARVRRQAAEALAKAGPPPAHPPQSNNPPTPAAAEDEADKTKPAPVPGLLDAEAAVRVADAERRAAKAEASEKEARREAEEARDRAARDKVLAAERTAREAREREAAAEDRARAAEKKAAGADDAPAAEPVTPAPAPAAAGAGAADSPTAPGPQTASESGGSSQGRRLTVVPDIAQPEGDTMTPMTVIPEIRTLDGLMNALTIVKAMCEMRSEEAQAIADDDMALSNRLDQLEGELGEMEVDDKTLREIAELRESIHTQSKEAATYSGAAKDAGDFAVAVANAAFKSHGGIAEAVQSSPIEKAASAGYYER